MYKIEVTNRFKQSLKILKKVRCIAVSVLDVNKIINGTPVKRLKNGYNKRTYSF